MQLHHLLLRLQPCLDSHGNLDATKLRQHGFNDIAQCIELTVDDDACKTVQDWAERYRQLQQHAGCDAALSLWDSQGAKEVVERETGLDYWKDAIWSAVERHSRLNKLLESLLDQDAFRFAIRLVGVRRKNRRAIAPVVKAIRALLRHRTMLGRDALAWSLALEQCELGSEAEFAKFVDMLEHERLADICSLFRPQLPANTTAFSAFADVLFNMEPSEVQLSGRATFNFLVLGYGLLEHPRFSTLCTRVVRWPALDTPDGPQTPEGAARAIATAHLRRHATPMAVRQEAPQRSLRIALCVSGQLRGWRQAQETWQHLQLQGHEVDIFVHTWRNTGISMPSASGRRGVDRIFKHEPFVEAFIEAGVRFGDEAIAAAYPRFMAAVASGTTDASVDELCAVYGETATVVIEDEPPQFEDDPLHQRKMFYKLLAADDLAQASGSYDLHVRLRPDLTFLAPAEPVNWPTVLHACQANNTLLTGRPCVTTSLLVDDRFVIGTPEQMRVFAQTCQTLSRATSERWYGFPRHLRAHASAAWTLLYQAVGTADLPVRLGPLVGVKVWENAEIRAALLADLPNGPRSAMDGLLLNALD